MLLEQKCPVMDCSSKHPVSCKFWLRESRGCFRGDLCKYLHRVEERGKSIKDAEFHHKKNYQVIAEVAKPNVEKVKDVEEQEMK